MNLSGDSIGVPLSGLSVIALTRNMFMASITAQMKTSPDLFTICGNSPRLLDGNPKASLPNRSKAIHASVEDCATQGVLTEKLLDLWILPIVTPLWPLNGDSPSFG